MVATEMEVAWGLVLDSWAVPQGPSRDAVEGVLHVALRRRAPLSQGEIDCIRAYFRDRARRELNLNVIELQGRPFANRYEAKKRDAMAAAPSDSLITEQID